MNVTRLFLGQPSGARLTHIRSARSEVVRTWQELHDNVAALGTSLRDIGIRPGERLLILSTSRVEVIECVLAAFSIGAAAMPVAPSMGRTVLQKIVQNMKPTCCVFEDVPEPEVLQALNDISCALISLEDANAAAPWRSYAAMIDRPGCELILGSFADEHPALIIHSSGSTGTPKVIVMKHGTLVRHFEYHNFVWSQYADADDSLVATGAMIAGLPLNHLAGISLCLQGMLNGRHSYVLGFFLPNLYLKLIERTRCAAMFLVPSMYRALLNDPYLQQMDRSALRCCITGGEPCPPELIRRIETAFGVPLATAYSMTECLSGIGHSRREIFGRRIKPGSCGQQLFGEVSLRDANGAEQRDFGELWVRNATVHRCYLDPAMNDARLHGGWFRTGDLFARDEDGDFFHRGRVDDMFICNGKNIYPLEVETLLMECPGVEAVCAAPVTSPHKGTVPAVLVVASRPLSSREVQNHVRRNGPLHTVPQFVMFAESLPLLEAGKVSRQKVASLLQAGFDSARETAAST